MRELISTTTIVFTLMAAMANAQAAEVTAKIRWIDASKKAITLADGKVYQVGQAFDLKSLKVGNRVKVTYDAAGKVQTASKVEVVK